MERILGLVEHEPIERVRAAFTRAGLNYDQVRRQPKLSRPVKTADRTVERVCESQCDLLVRELRPADEVVDDVRRLILAAPLNRSPKLEDLARKMLMSTRTLERRLQAAGTGVRKIDNEVRMQLAARYLALGYLSFKEIAYTLGYSQPATFYRAFKTWHGMPPKAYLESVSAEGQT